MKQNIYYSYRAVIGREMANVICSYMEVSMRAFVTFAIFVGLAFPAFSQSANSQRLTALSESMGRTINVSTTALADFDSQIGEDGDIKVYTSFRRRFESLSRALEDSATRLNLYLRTNERTDVIKAERDNYEYLLKEVQAIKSEFDNYVRSNR